MSVSDFIVCKEIIERAHVIVPEGEVDAAVEELKALGYDHNVSLMREYNLIMAERLWVRADEKTTPLEEVRKEVRKQMREEKP